jgi:hypothetical protein
MSSEKEVQSLIEVKVAKTGRAWKFGFCSDMSLALEVLGQTEWCMPALPCNLLLNTSATAAGYLCNGWLQLIDE